MRHIDLTRPAAPGGDPARTARLTRHLKARLEDFGPGGPEVVSAQEKTGTVAARFPGHDASQVVMALERSGVQAAPEGELVLFRLSPQTAFEELDYLWGCLFEILG